MQKKQIEGNSQAYENSRHETNGGGLDTTEGGHVCADTDSDVLWFKWKFIFWGGGYIQSKWTKGSILTKIIGTFKSEMPGNSAGNFVTLHEFHSLLICNGVK